MRSLCLLLIFFLLIKNSHCQNTPSVNPDLLAKKWKAEWISVPGEPESDFGVYHFRKVIELNEKPQSFVIHVSGDNRYKLFVNGTLVSLGPARGDLYHWYFETVDIAPYLKQGKNALASVVWNFGKQRPEAQISFKTGFIVQGNTGQEEVVNTNNSWKCVRNNAYTPLTPDLIHTYYVVGPGERIDISKYPSGWETEAFNDEAWKNAKTIFQGLPKGVFAHQFGWMLTPRTIPPMELTSERLNAVRKSEGIKNSSKFPKEKVPLEIPASSKVTLLLDQGHLTNAYPVLRMSGGKNALISMSYAEALYVNDKSDYKELKNKGNRNEVEGKKFIGVRDELVSSGAKDQAYTSLWYRTYRYIELKIETKEEKLIIDDLYGIFTGYPFEMKAKFDAGNAEFNKIMEIGWRTARLCATETYMDCPYYEQLQYVGDTRIQALVSLFNSGDDRLMRNAITQLDYSRRAEGITLSRYPTANDQQIPPFSLWWIGMVHDYWMYSKDPEFVKTMLPGVRQVLNFFASKQQPSGLLGFVPYWTFSDWAKQWKDGVAPKGSNQNGAVLDFQLLFAYQLAAELEDALGFKDLKNQYGAEADKIKNAIRETYWDGGKKMFADVPEKNIFSQHSNSLAVLTGTISAEEGKDLMQRILKDTTLTQATIYFKYYLHKAGIKAGLGDNYADWLGEWRKQMANGLTTWAEEPEPTRSDCHAWGASPNIEFLRTVLGVDTGAPGFSKVNIKPHLGKLKQASGTVPHPKGEILVKYTIDNKGKLNTEVTLPQGLEGVFVWKGKSQELKGGVNKFRE